MSLTDKPTFYTMRARVDTTVQDLCQPVYSYSDKGVHRYHTVYTHSPCV